MMPSPIHTGKVRDTYRAPDPDHLIMVASDRISVFDVVLDRPVRGKGWVLTHLTEHWLRHTPVAELAPNHLVTTDPNQLPGWAHEFSGRAMLVRRAEMLPAEFIVRGYLTGSGLKDYQRTGAISGVDLPDGLVEMSHFPEAIFTPSTKATEGHDTNITFDELIDLLGDRGLAERARQLALAVYYAGAAYALERGIILIDTKFEFGLIDGELTICDEVLTPDSSRYTRVSDYQAGQPPVSLDKQRVRDHYERLGWNKQPPAPPLPEKVALETSDLYWQIDRLLTD